MAMDPMDEFEFKPITEGLGFHKKAEKIKADVKSGSSSLVQDRVARSIPDAPPESGAGASFFSGGLLGGTFGSSSGSSSGKKKASAHSGYVDLSVPDHAPANLSERSSSSFSDQISSKASSLNDLASSLGLTDSSFGSSSHSNSGHSNSGSMARPATQSISDLINSLPPSLDFVEDKTPMSVATHASTKADSRPLSQKGLGATSVGHSTSQLSSHSTSQLTTLSLESEPSRPQIFQPLGRDDYGSANGGTNNGSSNGSNGGMGGGSFGATIPAPTLASAPLAAANTRGSTARSAPVAPLASPSPLAGPTIGSTVGSVLAPTPGTTAGATIGGTMGNTSGSSYLPTPGSKAVNTPSTAAAATIAPASQYRGRLDESYARAFPHAEKKSDTDNTISRDPQIEGLEAIATNMTGGILDGMVSMGLATVLLVSILAITHINLMGLIRNADTQMTTLINLGGLFLIVNMMYMLITRIFTGSSLGEWAFDLQMGSDDDRQTIAYFFKLIWRQVVLSATAFVPFPLLSFLMGRDIMRPLSGLQLYRRVD